MRVPRLFPSGRSGLLGLVTLALAGSIGAPAASLAGEPILVIMDRAKVMRVSRPADTVIIGNPAIADAAIQDSRTLIITGRSYGSTNLIVLDSAGQPIADEVLLVQPPEEALVTVFKRSSRETLSCTPICAPTVTIGDNKDTFDSTTGQVQAHHGLTGTLSN